MAKIFAPKTALKYAYLHGFASSPLSAKGVQLHRWFEKKLKLSLELPDLNIPSFREQCLSNMVDHIERQIQHSESRWFLIGSSFGGLVATHVTQRQPQSIHSLLLLAPAFNPIERWTSRFDIKQWKTDGTLHYFNPTTQSEEPINYQFFHDLQMHPGYPLVSTCPVTIIHGLHDDIVPIETSREYIQRLKSTTEHPITIFEFDDDHHLRTKKTMTLIKQQIVEMLER